MDLAAIRSLMPVTRHYNFLDHAAVAPLCGPAAEALRAYVEEATGHGHVRGGLYPRVKQARQFACKLINCHEEEITFVKNTSEGLSFVAGGLQFSRGDNIVTTGVEFPANIYPWMHLRDQGVQLRMVPEERGRIPLEHLIELINDRTRVVTVSAVQFGSGFRTDLAALGAECERRGVLFVVDAIQGLGVTPIDVQAMKIDFLSADGHKWLLAPEGAGIFYCRSEVQGLLRPTCVGWLGVKDAMNFGQYKLQFRDDARRFDSGSYNVAGIWGLGAAIEWFLQIGIDNIWDRVEALTDRLAEGVQEKGYRVVSSRTASESSGIVAFVSDVHDHGRIVSHLRQEYRTIVASRLGRIRVSPHFYNTEEEIDQLIEHLPAH